MNLSFKEFKAKIAETKAAIAKAFTREHAPKTAGKVSMTLKRKWRRNYKTRPRAACDSFRYRQKHAGEIRAKHRREQGERRRNRLTGVSSSLRKTAPRA